MLLGPSALLMLAQAASSAPPTSTQAQNPAPAARTPAKPTAADGCPEPAADSRTIVICTQRNQGYRLNPDVMVAKRETHSGGRPPRPGGKVIPDCATVGPAPCTIAGVNLIGVALTAAEMAERAAKGQEIGSMFVTDPHPTEYQLYLMAKARREAEEADEAAAKTKAAAESASKDAPEPN